MFKPELLSPAGSQESVYAAVNNGADAVYLGGKQFGARQFADNFSNTELEEIIDYCHLRGVKVYVTVNTLYKEKELKPMMDFVKCLYEAGADAVAIGFDSKAESNFDRLLIPNEHFAEGSKKLTVTFTCQTRIGETVLRTETKTVTTEKDVVLMQGHAYNFIISLSNPGEKIQFTVEKINDWENKPDTEI